MLLKWRRRKCFFFVGNLNQYWIFRWTGYGNEDGIIKLVHFNDTVGEGYVAIIYGSGKSEYRHAVRLIAAKGRVTPLKAWVGQAADDYIISKLDLGNVMQSTEIFWDVGRSLRPSGVRHDYNPGECTKCTPPPNWLYIWKCRDWTWRSFPSSTLWEEGISL